MNLTDAINSRRSIRGYLPKPVDKETLEKVLTLAGRAVSGVNAQPWDLVVVTGEKLDSMREENIRRLRAGDPPEIMGKYDDVSGVYDTRRRTVGKQLYAAMGIARDDKKARAEWGERGFRFFDAPAVVFVCMDETLDENTFRMDLGCVIQNICLAAMEYGLGTCVEQQAVRYTASSLYSMGLPENKKLIMGIAIGYPDENFPANAVVTERASLEENTIWIGF